MERSPLLLLTTIRFFCLASNNYSEGRSDFELLGVAESVADLEKLLEKGKPQVILMDFELPRGMGLVRLLLSASSRPETKVVMLTGYDNPGSYLSRPEGRGSRLSAQKTPAPKRFLKHSEKSPTERFF